MPSSSSSLTPAQHAVIRRHLLLIPIYIWTVYIWLTFFRQLPLGLPGADVRIFRDFVHFYVLGTIARMHDTAALYDASAQWAITVRAVPGMVNTTFPPSYGPQVGLLFAPFAWFTYLHALYLWLAFTIALYGVCTYLLSCTCPALGPYKGTVFLLWAAFPGVHFDLMFGQTSALALACFTLAYLALRANRRFLAGLAIGLLFYKPQLGLAAGIVFVCAGEWRIVAGALLAALAQMVIGSSYWGIPVLSAYATALTHIPDTIGQIEPARRQMHSWRSFFQLLGLASQWVFWATIAASILTAGAALLSWRTKAAQLELRFSVLLLATALINPHMYSYDLVILMPLFLLVGDWLLRTWPAFTQGWRLSLAGLLVFVFFSPVLALLLHTPGQLSVLGMALLTGLLVLPPVKILCNSVPTT
jgi:hypothetical protein